MLLRSFQELNIPEGLQDRPGIPAPMTMDHNCLCSLAILDMGKA